MTAFALVGYLVIGALIVAGIWWLVTNLTLKPQPTRYSYTKDEQGNDVIIDKGEGE